MFIKNVNAYFNDHCLGKNNCTLPIDILSKNSCQRPPRRLKVLFECNRGFWWREKHPAPVNTCANSLREVMCPSRYHIHIRNIWSQSEGTQSDCDSMDTNCFTNTLKRLCNENRRCIHDTTKTSCLFHQRFANIQFSCRRQTDPLATTSIPSTSSDNELVTTALAVYEITSDNTDMHGKYATNVPTDDVDKVKSKSSNLGVIVGIPAAIVVVICVIVVMIVFIRRRPISKNCHKENTTSITQKEEKVIIQETGSYEFTNVALRLSDHYNDPLESTELSCGSVYINLQRKENDSLTRNGVTGRFQRTCFYERTHVLSRLSDHTYDQIESQEYYNMATVAVPPAK
ncbi:uncharacterized protein [Mytilus edulis]|uniref:uncharacterized protein isoform X1 n=1 Tax=Mytilus edulis TaxID=6550 RepID=UPI0039EF9506